jgi:hypothetical protein
MFEEEGRGMFLSEGGPAGKISYDPIEHSGLVSGDIIDTSIWTNLLSVDGKPCEFDQVHKSTDVLAIYCDPR